MKKKKKDLNIDNEVTNNPKGKTNKSKTNDSQTSKSKTSESKTSKAKTSESKTSKPKTSGSKTSKLKTYKSKTSDTKISKPKTSSSKTNKLKTTNTKTSKSKTSESKTSKAKTSGPKTNESKTSKSKSSKSKTNKSKTSKSKTSDTKTSKSKSNEIKTEEKPKNTNIVENDYMKVIKTSVSKIIKNGETKHGLKYLDIIQDTVYRTNKIVFHTYNFLKLYILHLYENNIKIPDIDSQFIANIMSVVSIAKTKAGSKCSGKSNALRKNLNNFFNKYYIKTIDKKDLPSSFLLFQNLKYERVDMITNIKNNIQEHFIKHLEKFIKIKMKLKKRSSDIKNLKISQEERKIKYKELYK